MNLKNVPAGILDNEGKKISYCVPGGIRTPVHGISMPGGKEKESVNSGAQETRLTWLSIFNTSSCGSPS